MRLTGALAFLMSLSLLHALSFHERVNIGQSHGQLQQLPGPDMPMGKAQAAKDEQCAMR